MSPPRDRERLRIKANTVYTSVSIRLRFEPIGWAVFIVDEDLGALSVQSDWGDYNYAWGHGGRGGKTLMQFLATCSEGYIAGKLLAGRKGIVDAEATRKAMKQYVREQFKLGRMKLLFRDHHRESDFELMRMLMSEIGNFYSNIRDLDPDTFMDPFAGELMQEVFNPVYEYIVTKMHPWHAMLYWEIVPTFQAYLRGEIDGHGPPTAVLPGTPSVVADG
jgi:hypothetical protein